MSLKTHVLPIFLSIFLLSACSGNSSSSSSTIPDTLNVVLGVVDNGYASSMDVQGVAVTTNGKLMLDEETGALSGVRTTTDKRGRFALALDAGDPNAIVMFASAKDDSKVQCQLPAGCTVGTETVAFGDDFFPELFFDYRENIYQDDNDADDDYVESRALWSAAIDVANKGQFISINNITGMAAYFGFSTYVSDESGQCDAQSCESTTQADGYFSKYGIVKANTQVSNLIGISDILSVEPANLFNLNTISATTSANLQASIRYGALLAALQKIQLEYDNVLTDKDQRRFRYMLNQQFAQNRGQLYQKDAPIEQVLTQEIWYGLAQELLQQASDYYTQHNQVLPVEVGSVITQFQQQRQFLTAGELTAAVPTISADMVDEYHSAIDFTKAMINHLLNLANEFSNPEYQQKAKAYEQQLVDIGNDVSPALDAITVSLLDVYVYYLSCMHEVCDSANAWHQYNAGFDKANKTLLLKYSDAPGDELKLSQSVVDLITNDDIDNPTESTVIDFIIEGRLKGTDLVVNTDFSEGKVEKPSIRISYYEIVSELQPDAALATLNPSMPSANQINSRSYDFNFPSLEVLYAPKDKPENEQTIIGSFSWLLLGVNDIRNSNAGTRYNLNNISVVLNMSGAELGMDGDEVLRDNLVVSAVGSAYNSSNYYPDTIFPKSTNYFVPRDGFEFEASSGIDILETSIVDYTFPQVDSEGVPLVGSIVEGQVVAGKGIAVKILRFDYLHSGSGLFIAYPQSSDGKFLGLVCTITLQDEVYFEQGAITRPADTSGADPANIFNCIGQSYYEGSGGVNDLVKELWKIEPDVIRAVNVRGEGVYYADLPTVGADDNKQLVDFSAAPVRYTGTMQAPAMLGIDNLRLQIRPQLISSDNTKKLAEVAIDLNLIRPTKASINVGLFVAYNPVQILNTEDGLPIVASGDDVESYYIAYKTDQDGNEIGNLIINWYGAQLVDGGDGSQYLQDYDPSNPAPKEDFLFNIGSDVSYGAKDSTAGYTRCGLINPDLDSERECEGVAYLTFRGFVTGTVREERDGVYVARYIDGSWQVIGN
ncbi:hypothetical protein A9R00_07480 [Oleispira antarctica]|uniref:Carboxypeptidase regulatory-like domain-containing protein n=1 Tax=Oleispira antarctica TaxID=188908 RepID=A0A1Y5HS69_OLEAN|nr:hypothetical protein A9R00_07480 [Oleispira antarctica]